MNNLKEIVTKLKSLVIDLENYISKENQVNLIEPNVDLEPNLEDFEKLKLMLNEKEWPEAVDPSLICDKDSEEEKMDRGLSISEIFFGDPKNKKILDYGCGEGHVIQSLQSMEVNIAIGYDIEKTGSLEWEKQLNNTILTIDRKILTQNHPYDIILLHDVLDHVDNPLLVLTDIKNLSSKKTKILVKCHPWCCRHGDHTYTTINKAFLHLVFSEKELNLLGINTKIKNLKVTSPLDTYRKYFKDSGFEIIHENVDRQNVESFFERDILTNRISNNFNKKEKLPKFQMEQNFINYELQIV